MHKSPTRNSQQRIWPSGATISQTSGHGDFRTVHDDPARMVGWCNEALRLCPHNPIVLRQAAADVTLGGAAVPAGATVVAFTQAAMFDPAQFPNPGRLDPTRARKLYRHFGGGLHPCAGRAVNEVQIPELVRRVLKRGIVSANRPCFDGPFIDELVVTFRGSAQ